MQVKRKTWRLLLLAHLLTYPVDSLSYLLFLISKYGGLRESFSYQGLPDFLEYLQTPIGLCVTILVVVSLVLVLFTRPGSE